MNRSVYKYPLDNPSMPTASSFKSLYQNKIVNVGSVYPLGFRTVILFLDHNARRADGLSGGRNLKGDKMYSAQDISRWAFAAITFSTELKGDHDSIIRMDHLKESNYIDGVISRRYIAPVVICLTQKLFSILKRICIFRASERNKEQARSVECDQTDLRNIFKITSELRTKIWKRLQSGLTLKDVPLVNASGSVSSSCGPTCDVDTCHTFDVDKDQWWHTKFTARNSTASLRLRLRDQWSSSSVYSDRTRIYKANKAIFKLEGAWTVCRLHWASHCPNLEESWPTRQTRSWWQSYSLPARKAEGDRTSERLPPLKFSANSKALWPTKPTVKPWTSSPRIRSRSERPLVTRPFTSSAPKNADATNPFIDPSTTVWVGFSRFSRRNKAWKMAIERYVLRPLGIKITDAEHTKKVDVEVVSRKP